MVLGHSKRARHPSVTREHKAALEAAANVRAKLSDRITTHHARSSADRRGDSSRMHRAYMSLMARKGRKVSPKAKGKKQRRYSALDF